jgi:hypothetical protein
MGFRKVCESLCSTGFENIDKGLAGTGFLALFTDIFHLLMNHLGPFQRAPPAPQAILKSFHEALLVDVTRLNYRCERSINTLKSK